MAKTNLYPLIKAQKASIRVIARKPYRYSSDQLYRDFMVLNARQLYVRQVLICYRKELQRDNGKPTSSAPAGLRFTSEPVDSVVPSGWSLNLNCAVSKPGSSLEPFVRWRHYQNDSVPFVDLDTQFLNDGRRSILTNGSLRISSLEEGNGLSGLYQCVVSVEGIGTIVSRIAYVAVASLSGFLSQPADARVAIGGSTLLACGAAPPYTSGVPRLALRLSHPFLSPDRRIGHTGPPTPPTVDIRISWLKNGAVLPLEGARLALLPSGALEIDPVLASDAGVYRCNVTLVHGGQFRLSNNAELTVDSDPTNAEVVSAPAFTATPVSQTVLEGSTVYFDCAAVGNPKPEIIWLFNGGAIDLNDLDSFATSIGASGGVLALRGVRATHAGSYTCRAHNRDDSTDATAELNVMVPPRVTVRGLINGTTSTGGGVQATARGDVELQCTSKGRPAPRSHWLKDGEPLTPNNHDMTIVNGNNLRIQGVMWLDMGMFQCISSSPAGSAQAALRLSVIGADPTKIKNRSRPTAKSPNDKRKLRVPSEYFSDSAAQFDPKTFLTSLKSSDGAPPSVGKRENPAPMSQLNSHDILTSLISAEGSPEESGPLLTLPSEDLGETSPGFTAVPEQPSAANESAGRRPSEPRQLQAVIVKARFVTLTWIEPVDPNGEIEAYSVIYKVKGSQRERAFKLSRAAIHEANVPALQPETDYEFRLVAYNTNGPGASSQVLEVTTQSEDNIIGPPTEVKVLPISSTSLIVTWKEPEQNEKNIPIEKYQLSWVEAESNKEQTTTTADLRYRLSDLRAYSGYTIRVAALGRVSGAQETGSAAEVSIRTPGDIPLEPPRNLTAERHSSTSIWVKWSPPPVRSIRGPLTGHKVRYRAMQTSGQTRKRADSLTTPADVRSVTISDLDPTMTYQVRICALNVNGSGPFSEWVTVETGSQDLPEDKVPSEPGPLRTRAGYDTISVWWSAAEDGGSVEGYTLAWGKGIPDVSFQGLDKASRHYTIRDLEPNSEYVISLRATNGLGDGPPVYANVRTGSELYTDTGDPSDPDDLDDLDDLEDLDDLDEDGRPPTPSLIPPIGLKVIVLSGTTAVVYWTDTTLAKSQLVTDSRYYVVRYAATDAGSPPRYRYFNATDLNCMIDELKPYTPYEFTVKLVKGGRESPWSMVVSNRTLEAPPLSAPRDLSARPSGPSDGLPSDMASTGTAGGSGVDLRWLPPSKANGLITGYVILYSEDSSRRDRDWVVVGVVGERRGARVEGLRPHRHYHFKVQARNAKGYGPFTSTVSVVTSAAESPRGGASLTLYICVGAAGAVVALAGVVAVTVCCRRRPPSHSTPSHMHDYAKSTYQKASASTGIKPPDLWIHHDQMELKHVDKSHHSSSASAAGSADNASQIVTSSMTLPRARDSVDYEPAHRLPSNLQHSLDKRQYVPTYVGCATPPLEDAHLLTNRQSPSVVSGGSGASSYTNRCKPIISLADYCGEERSMASVGSCLSAGCDRAGVGSLGPLGLAGTPQGMIQAGPGYATRLTARPHLTIDQNTPLLSGINLGSPQSSLGSLGATHHTGTLPCVGGVCPLGTACMVGSGSAATWSGGDPFSAAARERERGHYVAYEPLAGYTHRECQEASSSAASSVVGAPSCPQHINSLSRRGLHPTPMATLAPLHSFSAQPSNEEHATNSNASSHHSTPQKASALVTPNTTSPYKKTTMVQSSPATSNRLQQGSSIPYSLEEAESLTPSRSTERLHREMQNLEGLMKDLNAITQNQFQC